MRTLAGILIATSLALLTSCATIDFNATGITQAPVKLNAVGEPAYDVISSFEIADKGGWVLGLIPVNKPAGDRHDYFATMIDREIRAAGGDAAVNVHIRAQNGVGDIVIGIVTTGIYQTRTVLVTGDVVKYR